MCALGQSDSRIPQALVRERRWGLLAACRLAIPLLKISTKVTHIFVLFDLLRSVFLLKEVADFDIGSLDFVSL